MTLLTFLTCFLVYLFLASLIVVGFYIITRGEMILQPGGWYIRKGKILMLWSLYWEEKIGSEPVYITQERLRDKLQWIQEVNHSLGKLLRIASSDDHLEAERQLSEDDVAHIGELVHCKVAVQGAFQVFLYTDEPIYRFPILLRYPLSQCPPCMASIFGSLLYWGVVYLDDQMMAWCHQATTAYLYFWVLFCLALSCMNKLISRWVDA